MKTLRENIASLFEENILYLKCQTQHHFNSHHIDSIEILLGVDSKEYDNRPDYYFHAIGKEGRVISTLIILEKVSSIFKYSTLKKISINIDVETLMTSSIINRLISVSEKISPVLCVEITEDVAIPDKDLSKLRTIMYSLKNKKIEFSMDDYGKGHSTSTRFKALPFNQLKFDKNFVNNDHQIKHHLNNDLYPLPDNIEIVFEGIEKYDELVKIKKLFFPNKKIYVQGFYFNKPSII